MVLVATVIVVPVVRRLERAVMLVVVVLSPGVPVELVLTLVLVEIILEI